MHCLQELFFRSLSLRSFPSAAFLQKPFFRNLHPSGAPHSAELLQETFFRSPPSAALHQEPSRGPLSGALLQETFFRSPSSGIFLLQEPLIQRLSFRRPSSGSCPLAALLQKPSSGPPSGNLLQEPFSFRSPPSGTFLLLQEPSPATLSHDLPAGSGAA